MTETGDIVTPAEPGAVEPGSHVASVNMAAGPLRLAASARITTGGLLAAGAVVSSILLSVTALIWAATSVARERERRRRR